MKGIRVKNNSAYSAIRLWTLAFVTVALASACGDGGSSADSDPWPVQSSENGITIYDAPDPAMQAPPDEPVIAEAVKLDVLPTTIHLDDTGERIFIPEIGWMDLQEFWRIYENNAEMLPATLDLEAVHQIRQSLAEKNHDDA